jgi:hypothetical protein
MKIVAVLLAVAMLGLPGCLIIGAGKDGNQRGCSNGVETKSPEIVELMQQNQNVVAGRLNIGMTEPEVRGAFVDRVARGELGKDKGVLIVNNPYRTETVICQSSTAKVLWYYTSVKCDNGRIENDEMTPVLIVEGRLFGWGNRFYEQYCKRVQPPQPPVPPMPPKV